MAFVIYFLVLNWRNGMEVNTSYAFGKKIDAPFGEVELKIRAE